MSPDGRAEGVFEAPGGVSWLWCLKGLPESSGSAVWRLQGRTAGPQGQSLIARLTADLKGVTDNIHPLHVAFNPLLPLHSHHSTTVDPIVWLPVC